VRLVVLCALAALAPVLLVSCSPEGRYKVLSFFFDGVPPPEGLTAGGAAEAGPNVGTGLASRQEPSDVNAPKVAMASVHAPFGKGDTKNCEGCHNLERGYDVKAAPNELCKSCHPTYYKFGPSDWVHGPVAVGVCDYCHVPHESQYPHLLTRPEKQLCFSCHDPASVMAASQHADVGDKECTSCHDAHSAGNRMLLADETSRARKLGPGRPKLTASEHEPYVKRQCKACHDPDRSFAMLEKPKGLCFDCHKSLAEPTPGLVHHKPFEEGKCGTCHVAHESPNEYLLKEAPAKLCTECHKSEELNVDAHKGRMTASCIICHSGHEAKTKGLLKRSLEEETPEPAGGGPARR